MKNSLKLKIKSSKLRKGDEVKVVVGKDKGKTGKLEKVFSKENKALISGINQFKKHLKARSQNQKSEIVTITKPVPLANVRLICPKCKVPTRIGFNLDKDIKVRVCKKCEQVI